MAIPDLIAAAVVAANILGGVGGFMAARAWWPRHGLSPEPPSTRVFYLALLCLMLAFAGNSSVSALDMLMHWPPDPVLSSLDDLIWRAMGAAGCVGMIWSKLLSLPPQERRSWNILTVVFHPDTDQAVVRIFNATVRRMRRRNGI